MEIGFIGTGLMGSPMAANLIQAGYQVTVYNRTPEKTATLLEMGATLAAQVEDAVRDKSVFITMLSTPDAVKDVSRQILSHAASEAIWINCSTIDPKTAKEMGEIAAGYGVAYLDAPVKGSTKPAAQGTLLFLVGGDVQHLHAVTPLLQAMGREVRHTGAIGTGSALKLVFNQLLAQQMVILGEATRLALAAGIDRQTWLDQVIGDIVSPPFLSGKSEKLQQRQYPAEFPLNWMHKDLRLSLEEAALYNLDLPAAQAGLAYYAESLRQGQGSQDFTSIFELFTSDNSLS